jgi:transcriptional regulator with XRE-family HTH domain
MNYFSGNIRFLRNKRGLSQAEMLNNLGFPRTTWSSYENGVSQPDIDGILRIASFFGISVAELLEKDLSDHDFILSEPAVSAVEKTVLKDSIANYTRSSNRGGHLLKEIVNAKQQVIETQAQTINALQALIERLNSDLVKFHGEKE